MPKRQKLREYVLRSKKSPFLKEVLFTCCDHFASAHNYTDFGILVSLHESRNIHIAYKLLVRSLQKLQNMLQRTVKIG